jgi:HAE1 family hydrophobic/amphiphilic exporter-1
LGAMLAVLVVFIFLHNIRGTIIIAIAIPTSMIATFVPMYGLGFTLNTLSLLGL